jgi:plastocyanin
VPRIAAVAVLIITALGVTACGSSSSSSSTSAAPAATSAAAASSSSAPAASTSGSAASGSGAAPAVQADPSGQLKFNTTSLTAAAGTVRISFTNHAPEGHNLTLVKGSGSTVIAATPTFTGGSRTLTAKLAPGTYTYFCSVPGHRMGGMQGTLTVK